MPKRGKYHAKCKANIATCSKYHAKCKITRSKRSKYQQRKPERNPKPEAKKIKDYFELIG